MKIAVRLFASAREAVGASEIELHISPGSTVMDLKEAACRLYPALRRSPARWAVNLEFVDGRRELKAGDEVAFIPPVSGG